MFSKRFILMATALVAATSTLDSSVEAAILRGSVDCGPPNAPNQGSVLYSSTKIGATARFTCMRGTAMQGSSSTSCTKFGTWSQATPVCSIVYQKRNDGTYKNNDAGYKLYSG